MTSRLSRRIVSRSFPYTSAMKYCIPRAISDRYRLTRSRGVQAIRLAPRSSDSGGGERLNLAVCVIALGGAADPFVLTGIRGVGVARHLFQGSSFSAATDQDRNVWPLHRPWSSQLGVVDPEVLASIAHRGVTPKPGNDFYRFSERLMPLSRRSKAHRRLLQLPAILPHPDT